MKKSQVARLLANVTGRVNQQLLLQNEYLLAENRILRGHLPTQVWWAEVKLKFGRSGWVNMNAAAFDGIDALASLSGHSRLLQPCVRAVFP